VIKVLAELSKIIPDLATNSRMRHVQSCIKFHEKNTETLNLPQTYYTVFSIYCIGAVFCHIEVPLYVYIFLNHD